MAEETTVYPWPRLSRAQDLVVWAGLLVDQLQKLGIDRLLLPRARGVITTTTTIPKASFNILNIPFISGGGIITISGNLVLIFDGSPQANAACRIYLAIDNGNPVSWDTPFTGTGQPFTVPIQIHNTFRVLPGNHTLNITLQDIGVIGTSVTVGPSAITISEMV